MNTYFLVKRTHVLNSEETFIEFLITKIKCNHLIIEFIGAH